jgi:hypothetical protein
MNRNGNFGGNFTNNINSKGLRPGDTALNNKKGILICLLS